MIHNIREISWNFASLRELTSIMFASRVQLCWTYRLISPIPQRTYPISHTYTYFRTGMCTFLIWMVHCGIWDRCIVEFVNLIFWEPIIPQLNDRIISWPRSDTVSCELTSRQRRGKVITGTDFALIHGKYHHFWYYKFSQEFSSNMLNDIVCSANLHPKSWTVK